MPGKSLSCQDRNDSGSQKPRRDAATSVWKGEFTPIHIRRHSGILVLLFVLTGCIMSSTTVHDPLNASAASLEDWYGVFFYQRGPIRASVLALWSYAVLGLCLRFLARRLSRAGFWYDDWLLIPAIVSNDMKL